MISRNDLSKKFDLIVKQEIINHNKQIEATNLSLVDIKSSIKIIAEKLSLFALKTDSSIKNLEDKVEFLFDHISNHKSSIKEVKKKSEDDILKLDFDVSRRMDYIEYYYVEKQDAEESISSVKEEIKNLRSDLTENKDLIISSIHKIIQDNDKCFSEFKEDIINKPSEFISIKKELEDKINSFKVDSEGLLKSIKVFSKEVFVMEKKIEHIYSLIGFNKKP